MIRFFPSSLKSGDVLVFDRMFQVLPTAIRGSRCLPLDPSSANLSAKTPLKELVAKHLKGQDLLAPKGFSPVLASAVA